MNVWKRFALGTLLVAGGVYGAAAQDSTKPQVLQITREFVKPGKAGPPHDKTESLFVDAMRKAKWPTYYLALSSLSGKSRVVFLTFYDNFDAWQKDQDGVEKNKTLSGELDKALQADGDLLDSVDQAVLHRREDLSLRTLTDLSGVRYVEAQTFRIKEGKTPQWEEAVKMVKAAYEKAVPGSHWGMFELMYGGEGHGFLVLIGHKSLDEIDKGFATDKDFLAAMGDDGMKKLNDLVEASVQDTSRQLFAVSPKMSYVREDWIAKDPFWKP